MRAHNGHSVDYIFIHSRAPAAKVLKAENDAPGLGNQRDTRRRDKKRKTKEVKEREEQRGAERGEASAAESAPTRQRERLLPGGLLSSSRQGDSAGPGRASVTKLGDLSSNPGTHTVEGET